MRDKQTACTAGLLPPAALPTKLVGKQYLSMRCDKRQTRRKPATQSYGSNVMQERDHDCQAAEDVSVSYVINS